MTAPLPVLGEKHIKAIHVEIPFDEIDKLLSEIEAHVRALVAGEVVMVKRSEIEEMATHEVREPCTSNDRMRAMARLHRWLTPQTQEKP